MEAFSRAFEAMRARPWHALGLAAILTAGTVVLGVVIAVMVVIFGTSIFSSTMSNLSGTGLAGLGDTISSLVGEVLVLIVLVVVVYGVGSLYMAAGFIGSAASALTSRGLQVDLATYFAFANRYFLRLLLLGVLFALASLGLTILVVAVAWVLRDAGLLLGLWLFVALLAVVLLWAPILSLGGSAAVLDDCSGVEAFSAAFRTVRRRPFEVAAISIIIAVIGLVVTLVAGELSRPFELLGTLVGAYVGSVLGLFSQLVWLFYYRAIWQSERRSVPAGPASPKAYPGTVASGSGPRDGRVGVLDRGVARPDLRVRPGEVLVVGRDPGADIRLDDPQVSRRHATVAFEASTWVVSDLGATNPARILEPGGSARPIRGVPARLPYGQIALGESVITLYPVGSRG
jgi:hypothetical protein